MYYPTKLHIIKKFKKYQLLSEQNILLQFKWILIFFISDRIPHVKYFEWFDVYIWQYIIITRVIWMVDNSLWSTVGTKRSHIACTDQVSLRYTLAFMYLPIYLKLFYYYYTTHRRLRSFRIGISRVFEKKKTTYFIIL